MKKNYLFLCFILSLLLTISCQDDEKFKPANDEVLTTSDYELPESEVLDMLNDFVGKAVGIGRQTKSGSGFTIKKQNKRHYSSNGLTTRSAGESNSVAFYNFDLDLGENNGHALVCADKRFPQVLAFSTKGTLEEIKKSGNVLASNYIEEIPVQISRILELRQNIPSLNMKANAGFPYYNIENVDWTSEDGTERIIYLLQSTKWDQGEPYNKYMDRLPNDPTERYAVGCSNIASANIMAYFKHPASFNGHVYHWDKVVEYDIVIPGWQPDSIIDIAGIICGDLFYASNSVHNVASGGSSTTAVGAYSAFKKMDYQCDLPQDYDLSKIRESLANFYPVWMGGADKDDTTSTTGHAFVVRGYWYNFYEEAEESGNGIIHENLTTECLGISWGAMGGFGDGWYLVRFDDLEIDIIGLSPKVFGDGGIGYGKDWSRDIKLITNIRPI